MRSLQVTTAMRGRPSGQNKVEAALRVPGETKIQLGSIQLGFIALNRALTGTGCRIVDLQPQAVQTPGDRRPPGGLQ
jgi:hypothetical protein